MKKIKTVLDLALEKINLRFDEMEEQLKQQHKDAIRTTELRYRSAGLDKVTLV